MTTVADLQQTATLTRVKRRIASATRIRWKYVQGPSTALTGNYVLGIYDASGRKIIDTGSVAFTGAINTVQVRSETITATTFEAGLYYVLFGVDVTNLGTISYMALSVETSAAGPWLPNIAVRSTTGGVTAPATLLSMTDAGASSTATSVTLPVPAIGLSVG